MARFSKKLNRIGRTVRANASENVSKALYGIPISLLGYLFLVFLSPFMFLYWMAIFIAVIAGFLLYRKKYLWSSVVLLGLFLVVFLSSLNATFLIAADEITFRYRTVGGASYLEFPNREWIISKFPRSFSNRLLVVKSCNGIKVARLPLLPYDPISAADSLLSAKPQFRRLPKLVLDQISAAITTSVGEESGTRFKHFLSLGSLVTDSSHAVIPVTEIFTRSIGCLEGGVPLLPIIEVLPWDSDDLGDLTLAATKSAELRRAYLSRSLTIDDLIELNSFKSDNQYASLLKFAANSLALHMIDGNIFAESRANIRDSMCLIIRHDEQAFRGPFSSLEENLYNEIAYGYGNRAYEAFPHCDVPHQLILQFENLKSDDQFLQSVKSLAGCFLKSANPLACGLLKEVDSSTNACRGRFCNNGKITAAISQQITFDLLDNEFEDTVVGINNVRYNVSSIPLSSCPALRDDEERRFFITRREEIDTNIQKEAFECDSPDWKRKYEVAEADFNETEVCKRSWKIDRDIPPAQDLFGRVLAIRCHRTDDSIADAFRFSLDDMVRSYKGDSDFGDLVNKLLMFRSIADRERIEAAISMIRTARGLVKSICDAYAPGRCTGGDREKHEVSTLAGTLLSALSDIGKIDASGDSGEKIAALFGRLSTVDSILVKIGLCDLAGEQIVQHALNGTRADICAQLGLSRYALVSDYRSGRSFIRLFHKEPDDKNAP